MKSTVEQLSPTRVRINVEVPFEELKPDFDKAYKALAQQIRLPGFRPGKAPAKLLEARVGRGAVLEQVVNDALPSRYSEAVTSASVKAIGQPEIEITKIEDGELLEFTAEVDVRPEIVLPDLSGVTVTVERAEATDDDVAARLETLRERFGTLVGVDRPAAEGDFVVLDLSATIDGEEVDSVTGVSYQVGSGTMLEGLDEALIGLSAGETTTFTAGLRGGEHEGEDALVTVTPTAVKQRDLPEADDDFAELASEFDTIEELREDLRSQVVEAKRLQQAASARAGLISALLEVVDFPVPSGVVEAEVEAHLEGEGRQEDDEHREEVRAEATEALRNQLLIDALADSLGVSVEQGDLVQFLLQTAQRYGMDPSTFISQADAAGQIPMYVAEVARSKAIALALRRVTVVDDDGAPVDLSAVVGTDEDETEADVVDATTAEAAEGETAEGETAETEAAETEAAAPRA